MTVDSHEHGAILVSEDPGKIQVVPLSAEHTLRIMEYAEASDPPPLKDEQPPAPAISRERVVFPLEAPEITNEPPSIEPFTIFSSHPGFVTVALSSLHTETHITLSHQGLQAFARNAKLFTDALQRNAKEEQARIQPNSRPASFSVPSPIVITNQEQLAAWESTQKPKPRTSSRAANYAAR